MSTRSSLIIAHAGLLITIVGGALIRRSDALYGWHPDLLLAGVGAGLSLLGLAAGVWACIDAANIAGRSAWHGLWGVTWAGPAAVWALTRPAKRWWYVWLPVAVLMSVVLMVGIATWNGNPPPNDLPPFRITTMDPPPHEDPPPVRLLTMPPPPRDGTKP